MVQDLSKVPTVLTGMGKEVFFG
eukprot:SAG25_NODE_1220_length_3576_cov_2.680184_7_plen_22_part_01